jgi:hypothetical protein
LCSARGRTTHRCGWRISCVSADSSTCPICERVCVLCVPASLVGWAVSGLFSGVTASAGTAGKTKLGNQPD